MNEDTICHGIVREESLWMGSRLGYTKHKVLETIVKGGGNRIREVGKEVYGENTLGEIIKVKANTGE